MESLPDHIDMPSRLTPRGFESADRGRLLIDAAYDLLEEDGLEGLTIRAVLKRTGLARRAFYDRFVGKDDLVLAVFEQTLRQSAQFLREHVAELDGPFARIRMVVSVLLLGALGSDGGTTEESAHRRSAALSREHLRLAESRPADLQAALSPLLDLMTEIVAEGIREGAFRSSDPALQARLIYNLVSTTLHTELLSEGGALVDRERRRQMSAEIWQFCCGAISV